MSLTESAEGAASTLPASATKVGQAAAKLAAWGVATVAVTFMLLRPRRRASGKRGGLFFGSGVIVVLCKTLLMVNDASDGTPAAVAATDAAPTTPVVARAPATAPAPRAVPKSTKPKAPAADAPKKTVAASVAAPARQARAPQGAKVAQGAKGTLPAVAHGAKVTQVAASAAPKAVPPRAGSVLGARYSDATSGYSVQFPAGWTYKTFSDGQCWILDATDGQSAVMSVGFSQFPAQLTVDQIVPAKVTKGLQSRPGTIVHATGYTNVGGRRCLWHKYTGPIPRTDGNPRMTAVHYLLPLHDGRALEVRVAATPEKFNELAPRMKQSLDSFKLTAMGSDPRTANAAPKAKVLPKG